ncbi:MAG: hypothetical protein A2073_06320 [Deltaproteobacteria bacterium GWC2_42_11]|nr:MAG: hypothetical protein A2073_06320 [Deltaproteobacteria bacterium GWC2_42_11]HBO84372.1 hypothetical protein [Deltaproteobacteria bacterium]
MTKVFFDTWGWVAIAHKNDTHHYEAITFCRNFLPNKGAPVTTDYILAETITLLRAKTEADGVNLFIDTILEAVEKGRILLERIDEKRWQKAWNQSKKYKDKSGISFVDFTSFVVMKEMGLTSALTADKHFEEIGMGFKKLF